MRAIVVALALASAAAVGACGGSSQEPAEAPEDAVEDALERHWEALRDRDVHAYCRSLFPAELVASRSPVRAEYERFQRTCSRDLAGFVRTAPLEALPDRVGHVTRLELRRRPAGTTGNATAELVASPPARLVSPPSVDLVRYDGDWRVVFDVR
jgi:hypothetical protein